MLQGFARACRSRITKPISILCFAPCCTVLHSRRCQVVSGPLLSALPKRASLADLKSRLKFLTLV